tara:strand:+ start:32 stop:496 length:465 start_codon:yes stop_codon:yes gene_type:complete
MKKLLGIVVLGWLLSGSANAFIYDCNIRDSLNNKIANFIVNVDDTSELRALMTTNSDTRKFEKGDIIISKGINSKIGQIIVTSNFGSFLKKGSYELFVSRVNEPGSDNYFTGIFKEPALGTPTIIHTLTISPWDMKVYVFLSDEPSEVLKGTCK